MREKNKKNLRGSLKKIFAVLMLGFFVMTASLAFAQETGSETLYEPVEKQIIQLTDDGASDDWNISRLETYGIKFLIRGKEALTWSLNITDSGFHNSGIENSYIKVLTIVNSLFVLGLLAIAVMWMFSILVSRKYLKKVILIYSMAVIFVNFALPVNQLFIDGTNLLQKTLLVGKDGNIQITDIVQTPDYESAISYLNADSASLISGKQTDEFTISLNTGETADVVIGSSGTGNIALNGQDLTIKRNVPFNVNQEQTIFRSAMIILTALAYFIIALIFILRIVILWALLILSPALLVLGIFRSTRGWFYNWLSLYGRWLFIGPLTALGIALIVNIWQISGLPVTVSDTFTPEIFSAGKSSNIVFYLPGKDTPNTLSNTQEMMEYIIFLLMIYLPIFLAFALTRQKTFRHATVSAYKSIIRKTSGKDMWVETGTTCTHDDGSSAGEDKKDGIFRSVTNLVNEKIIQIADKAIPVNKLKSEPAKPTEMMPTASNFLAENLKQTPVPKMLELLGKEKRSGKSHKEVIKKLANFQKIKDRKEKEKVMNIMREITERSINRDHEASVIVQEIQNLTGISLAGIQTNLTDAGKAVNNGANININVNDKSHDKDRKARDKSFDQKSVNTDTNGNDENDKKNEDSDKNEKEDDNPNPKQDETQE